MMGVYPAGLGGAAHRRPLCAGHERQLDAAAEAARAGARPAACRATRRCISTWSTTPDLGIRRSLKPRSCRPTRCDYLAPRPRVAYFFEPARAERGAGRGPGGVHDATGAPPCRRGPALLQAWAALLDGLPDAAWLVDARQPARGGRQRRGARAAGPAAARSLLGAAGRALIATPEDLAFWDECRRRRLRAAAVRHRAVRDADGRMRARHAQHPPLADLAPGPARAPLRWWWCSDRSAAQRAEDEREQLRGRTAGHARIHRRRHPGHRPGGPHPRLQPPLRADLGPARRPAARRATTTRVHDWMRRSVADAAAYQRRLQRHPRRDAAAGHRRLHAALGPGARARDAAAVHAAAGRSAASTRSATSPSSWRRSSASRRCRTPTR